MVTSTRTVTKYFYEDLELPFPADILMDKVVGNKRILGALVRDEGPEDPLQMYDEGEFYQFDRNYAHYKYRPSVEEFKDDVLRVNKKRVFYVCHSGDAYAISHRATLKNALEIEDVAGYYICPEDAGHKERYAKGVMEQYSAWACGDVWGVCVWAYEDGEEVDRGHEVWNYYGYKVAEEELKSTFDWYVKG